MHPSRLIRARVAAGLLLAGIAAAGLACQDGSITSPGAKSGAELSPSGPLPKKHDHGHGEGWGHGPGQDDGFWLGEPPGSPRGAGAAALSAGAQRKVACERKDGKTASAWIGSEGGTLKVGRHRLVVPPGALDTPTLITGTTPEDASATIVFEPSGLRFNTPAVLVLDVAGCEDPGELPSVMYIDDSGHPAEELRGVFDRARQEVSTPIHHFSGYQVWV